MNAKTEYGIVALAALAAAKGESRTIRAIADEHGMPPRFMVQILLQLKGAGYVDSTRGAAGGYRLVADPKKISLLDIITVLDGAPKAATSSTNDTEIVRSVRGAVQGAEDARIKLLAKTTLAKLIS